MRIRKIILIQAILILLFACSEKKSSPQDELFNNAITQLLMKKQISVDSSMKIISEYSELVKKDENKAKEFSEYWEKISNDESLSLNKEIQDNSFSDFVNGKVALFKTQIEKENSKNEIELSQSKLTKKFLSEQKNEIKNWEGKILSIDLYKDDELDIAIGIYNKKDIGKRKSGIDIYKCEYTVEAGQEKSIKRNTKGIKRNGDLYEKVMNLKEGDIVNFNAKIINYSDRVPESGIFLSTHFEIEIADITKK